jgi:hypothetical protein
VKIDVGKSDFLIVVAGFVRIREVVATQRDGVLTNSAAGSEKPF